MEFNLELAWRILPSLLKGAGMTLALIPPTMVLGMIISVPITLARLSSNRVLVGAAWAFTTFFRGAPALILLYMVYNGLATLSIVRDTFLWNLFSSAYACAIIGLTLNHAGFLTEVMRGAIQAVPQGLLDAGYALSLNRTKVFITITVPVALRLGLSAYKNEVILFTKGTAAVGAITVIDLLRVANETVSKTFDPLTPLVIAAAFYWLMVQFILFCFSTAERKLAFHT